MSKPVKIRLDFSVFQFYTQHQEEMNRPTRVLHTLYLLKET